MCFEFNLQISSDTFVILSRIQRDTITNVHRSSCGAPVILVRSEYNLNFPRQIFEKCSNIKFHENPSNGNRVASCGQKDGGTDTAKLTVAFSHFANAPIIECLFGWGKSYRSKCEAVYSPPKRGGGLWYSN
jgi:hypothetical protein